MQQIADCERRKKLLLVSSRRIACNGILAFHITAAVVAGDAAVTATTAVTCSIMKMGGMTVSAAFD